jgi:hypothetical protein
MSGLVQALEAMEKALGCLLPTTAFADRNSSRPMALRKRKTEQPGTLFLTAEENRLRLRELCQRYIDDQWVAAHMTNEQAAESLLDQFKRAVRAELELLEVGTTDVDRSTAR